MAAGCQVGDWRRQFSGRKVEVVQAEAEAEEGGEEEAAPEEEQAAKQCSTQVVSGLEDGWWRPGWWETDRASDFGKLRSWRVSMRHHHDMPMMMMAAVMRGQICRSCIGLSHWNDAGAQRM